MKKSRGTTAPGVNPAAMANPLHSVARRFTRPRFLLRIHHTHRLLGRLDCIAPQAAFGIHLLAL